MDEAVGAPGGEQLARFRRLDLPHAGHDAGTAGPWEGIGSRVLPEIVTVGTPAYRASRCIRTSAVSPARPVNPAAQCVARVLPLVLVVEAEQMATRSHSTDPLVPPVWVVGKSTARVWEVAQAGVAGVRRVVQV